MRPIGEAAMLRRPFLSRNDGAHAHPAQRRTPRAAAWLVGLLCLLLAAPAFAGKLDAVRSRTKSKSKSSSSSSSSSGDGTSSGGGSPDDYVLAFYVMASPWWLPHMAVGDRMGRPFGFDEYPYANGYDGYVHIQGRSAPMAQAPDGRAILGRSGAMQLAVEGAWLDPTMQRLGLAARISGGHRLEFDTSWSGYQEVLGPQDNANGRLIDALWFGDLNVTYLHAVGESVQMRSGVGARAMVDGPDTTWGVNFTYGIDIYPVRPLVISASFDLGNVGDALFRGARATVGLMVGRVEFYGGWDGIWVDEIALGGGLLGVRTYL